MGKTDKAKIIQLAAKLSMIPDLPKGPTKTLAQKINELAEDIKLLSDLRDKAVAENANDFDRLRFELKKDRLSMELKKLEQAAGR